MWWLDGGGWTVGYWDLLLDLGGALAGYVRS